MVRKLKSFGAQHTVAIVEGNRNSSLQRATVIFAIDLFSFRLRTGNGIFHVPLAVPCSALA